MHAYVNHDIHSSYYSFPNQMQSKVVMHWQQPFIGQNAVHHPFSLATELLEMLGPWPMNGTSSSSTGPLKVWSQGFGVIATGFLMIYGYTLVNIDSIVNFIPKGYRRGESKRGRKLTILPVQNVRKFTPLLRLIYATFSGSCHSWLL